jgi:hypothetical protein
MANRACALLSLRAGFTHKHCLDGANRFTKFALPKTPILTLPHVGVAVHRSSAPPVSLFVLIKISQHTTIWFLELINPSVTTPMPRQSQILTNQLRKNRVVRRLLPVHLLLHLDRRSRWSVVPGPTRHFHFSLRFSTNCRVSVPW